LKDELGMLKGVDTAEAIGEHVPPMPLKHPVETTLVFLLGLALAVTGLIIAVLPPLPYGALAWGIAFLVANAYPLALYTLFKRRRADYEFRALHFLPAILLFVWLVLELLIRSWPDVAHVQRWYTWGWALPGVLLAFVLLVSYCLSVVRRRGQRLFLLALVLIPFLVLGAGSRQWDIGHRVTALVRSGVMMLATGDFDDRNLAASTDSEEIWRMKMRRQGRRDARIAAQEAVPGASIASVTPTSAQSSVLIAVDQSARSAAGSASSAAPPPKLSHTGPMTEALAVFFVAGYCAVVQRRAQKRTR
jgi:hypothetical protein